jgi:putative DNA primase/helicase
VVLVCAKTKDDEGNERRILARSKSNLGPDDGGFQYTHEQVEVSPGIWANRTVWGNAVEGNAQTLLADTHDVHGQQGFNNEAADFLRQCLAKGLTPSKKVQAEAKEADISWASVRRAANKLGIIKRKGGMNDGWYWRLPNAEDAHLSPNLLEGAQEKMMGIFGRLRENLSTFEDRPNDPGEDF